MSGNLHKSDEGWARLRARSSQGQLVRASRMHHDPKWRAAEFAPPKRKGRKSMAAKDVAINASFQPRLRNRRRVVAPNGKFF